MTATPNSKHKSRAAKESGSARLTDTQLVVLSAAAGRDDRHLLPVPETIKARGNALAKSLTALIGKGLAKEVRVRRDQPEWRSADDGCRIGLKITKAGMAAIGVGQGARDRNNEQTCDEHNATVQSDPAVHSTRSARQSNGSAKTPHINGTTLPRSGTKTAAVIDLLKRNDGATIDELMAASGWQAHSVRGFLSGTVKKKLGLMLVAEVASDGARRYRITT